MTITYCSQFPDLWEMRMRRVDENVTLGYIWVFQVLRSIYVISDSHCEVQHSQERLLYIILGTICPNVQWIFWSSVIHLQWFHINWNLPVNISQRKMNFCWNFWRVPEIIPLLVSYITKICSYLCWLIFKQNW